MDGLPFMVLTVFQSYQKDGVIMKSCAQWDLVNRCKDFRLQGT